MRARSVAVMAFFLAAACSSSSAAPAGAQVCKASLEAFECPAALPSAPSPKCPAPSSGAGDYLGTCGSYLAWDVRGPGGATCFYDATTRALVGGRASDDVQHDCGDGTSSAVRVAGRYDLSCAVADAVPASCPVDGGVD